MSKQFRFRNFEEELPKMICFAYYLFLLVAQLNLPGTPRCRRRCLQSWPSVDCCFLVCKGCPERFTLQGTNISPTKALLKMVFLFPWWDMLVPGRVAKNKGLEYQHLAVLGAVWTLRHVLMFWQPLSSIQHPLEVPGMFFFWWGWGWFRFRFRWFSFFYLNMHLIRVWGWCCFFFSVGVCGVKKIFGILKLSAWKNQITTI